MKSCINRQMYLSVGKKEDGQFVLEAHIVIRDHFNESCLYVLYNIVTWRTVGWRLYSRNNFGRKRSDFEQTVIGTRWYGVMRVDWVILHEWRCMCVEWGLPEWTSSASVEAGVAGGAGGMAVMRGVWAEMVALSSCSATSNANDRHVATLRSRQQLD